jgi:hypothetical protein
LIQLPKMEFQVPTKNSLRLSPISAPVHSHQRVLMPYKKPLKLNLSSHWPSKQNKQKEIIFQSVNPSNIIFMTTINILMLLINYNHGQIEYLDKH